MNNLQQFLKEYYQLCKKYNMQFIAGKYQLDVELDLDKYVENDILAKDVTNFFGIEEIHYEDANGNHLDISAND